MANAESFEFNTTTTTIRGNTKDITARITFDNLPSCLVCSEPVSADVYTDHVGAILYRIPVCCSVECEMKHTMDSMLGLDLDD